jgi:hypothetical protein
MRCSSNSGSVGANFQRAPGPLLKFASWPRRVRSEQIFLQLCPSCTTEEDVDEQIRWLKQDLDEVAQAMKKAIRDRAR